MRAPERRPIVIAHRGASGYIPEHTLPAYLIAIEQGADFIEADLVMTGDGHLIARHDNELSLTTDVAARVAFASRQTNREIDGKRIEGWFSEDFSLAEIRQLRAIERIPDIRPANARFDGMFHIPTLAEIIDLVKTAERASGRRVGLYLETKHPGHFRACGLAIEAAVVKILMQHGYHRADDPIYVESFETDSLQRLAESCRLRLIQLIGTDDPADAVPGNRLSFREMVTPESLRRVAEYAQGIGPDKGLCGFLATANPGAAAVQTTSLVDRAHEAGLLVHPFTFRAENRFLLPPFRSSEDTAQRGDLAAELRPYLAAGIDGFFIDQPDLGVAVRDGPAGKN